MLYKISQKKRGFSLIELMVSVTLFAIVMTVAMGTILSIVNGNKKNQAYVVAIGNLNYAVDNMTREIKTGYGYGDESDNHTCNQVFYFKNTNDQDVEYAKADHPNGSAGLTIKYNNDTAAFVTSNEINITDLCFTVIGNVPNDGIQAAVMIYIGGETITGKDDIKTKFNISTSVTQRQIDF